MCLIKKHLVFLLYEQNIRFEFLSIIIGMLTNVKFSVSEFIKLLEIGYYLADFVS